MKKVFFTFVLIIIIFSVTIAEAGRIKSKSSTYDLSKISTIQLLKVEYVNVKPNLYTPYVVDDEHKSTYDADSSDVISRTIESLRSAVIKRRKWELVEKKTDTSNIPQLKVKIWNVGSGEWYYPGVLDTREVVVTHRFRGQHFKREEYWKEEPCWNNCNYVSIEFILSDPKTNKIIYDVRDTRHDLTSTNDDMIKRICEFFVKDVQNNS